MKEIEFCFFFVLFSSPVFSVSFQIFRVKHTKGLKKGKTKYHGRFFPFLQDSCVFFYYFSFIPHTCISLSSLLLSIRLRLLGLTSFPSAPSRSSLSLSLSFSLSLVLCVYLLDSLSLLLLLLLLLTCVLEQQSRRRPTNSPAAHSCSLASSSRLYFFLLLLLLLALVSVAHQQRSSFFHSFGF